MQTQIISDNPLLYSVKNFSIPKKYDGCIESVMLTNYAIQRQIKSFAQHMMGTQLHRGDSIDLICIMDGAKRFFDDFMIQFREIDEKDDMMIDYTTHFVRLKSYAGTNSSHKPDFSELEKLDLTGRKVLVMEDIVDTGNLMTEVVKVINSKNPNYAKVASMLVKRTPQSNGYKPDFGLFSIPNAFVIGYGMDYNEQFRDLDDLAVISKKGIEKFAEK